MTVRFAARIVVRTVYAAIGLYVASGVGLLGPKALEVNHTLVNRAVNGFMTVGERYFQSHPIVPVPQQAPSAQTQMTPNSQ